MKRYPVIFLFFIFLVCNLSAYGKLGWVEVDVTLFDNKEAIVDYRVFYNVVDGLSKPLHGFSVSIDAEHRLRPWKVACCRSEFPTIVCF